MNGAINQEILCVDNIHKDINNISKDAFDNLVLHVLIKYNLEYKRGIFHKCIGSSMK